MSSNSEYLADSNAPSQKRSGIDPMFLLQAFRLWWHYAIPGGLICAVGAAVGVWAISTPVYEAKASVRIEAGPKILPNKARSGGTQYANFQRGLITSRVVLGRALDELRGVDEIYQGEKDPITALRKLVKIRHDGGHFYLITCLHDNPETAKQIVNAVLHAYIAQVQYSGDEVSRLLLRKLASEIESQKSQVLILSKGLAELQRQIVPTYPRVAQSKGSQVVDLHPIEEMRKEMANLEVDIRLLDVEIDGVKARQLQKVKGAPTQSPQIAAIQSQIIELQQRIDARSQLVVDPKDPQLVADREHLASLVASKAAKQKELGEAFQTSFAEAAEATRQKELASLSKRRDMLSMRLNFLGEKREEEVRKLTDFTDEQVEVELKQQELSQAFQVLHQLKERHRQVSVESDPLSEIKMAFDAKTPNFPVETVPLKLMALGGGGAFFVPFLLCVLWELQSQRLTAADDLANQSDVPVIGELVAVNPSRADAGMRVYEDSVQNLKTYISLRWGNQASQVLAVCSAWTGEGKTTLASQLASAMSQRGRTLLIDGDTRMPDIHAIFHMEAGGMGLVDVLGGGTSASDTIRQAHEGLDVLPSGKLDSNPHVLFSGSAFEELIEWARGEYDFIVIDTPPVLAAAESLVMARAADRTLVCAMRDVSRKDRVIESQNRLLTAGVNVSGVVFSGVSSRQYSYRYGAYGYQ